MRTFTIGTLAIREYAKTQHGGNAMTHHGTAPELSTRHFKEFSAAVARQVPTEIDKTRAQQLIDEQWRLKTILENALALDEATYSLLLRAFAYAQTLVARELVAMLLPKLSPAEREYVEKDGPEIEKLYEYYAQVSAVAACSEGRQALRQARTLKESSHAKLVAAGIDQEREDLLRELVHASLLNWSWHHPPRKAEDILHWLREGVGPEKIGKFLKLAESLEARPMLVSAFLRSTLECAEAAAKRP